jgi:Xaa-Pro aminopeptidase
LTEIEQRQRAVASRLGEHKVDSLLLTSPANVRYLSGYGGSNGLILLTPSETHLFTDPRYALEVSGTITCKVHVSKGLLISAAASTIKRKKLKKVGFESASLRYEDHAKLKDLLPLGYFLKPLGALVEEQRMVKSTAEIDKVRKSVQVNSEAYARTMRRVRRGAREQEIAAELEYQMRVLGAEKPAFETIVAAGARSALPHARPTDHRLEKNELLLIDMGAFLDGYASDMTRVACFGSPSKRTRDMYRAVMEAQSAAVDAVRPGVTANSVDGAARKVLKAHNLGREFVHSTGHGLGLEIHEMPKVGRKDKTRLRAGMTITIEPGAYVEGLGGIRIEDTVLVTENGCEVLTPTSKEFVRL